MQTTWEQLREAIKSTGNPEALRLFDEAASSMASQQDSTISFVAMSLTRFVQKTGEESLEELFRRRYLPVVQEWIKTTPGPKESAERFARLMQHPLTKTTLDEEPERYVVRLDPCRTGGRLRRNIAAGAYDAAVPIGSNKKPFPWSWGRTGICYYCLHSPFLFEILPIELRGYPIAVIDYEIDPAKPCTLYFYKQPEAIPEEFFRRVGKTKTIK